MPPLTPAYVAYLERDLADRLDEIYHDDETPYGEAFRNRLRFTLQTYCQQHDQAGEQTAAFAEHIPCNNEFGIEGAIGGLMILRQTREALTELLQDDADFLESYRGEHVTDDETDRSVREDAREFTKRNEVSSEINAIVHQTATEGEATEKEIIDASYDFKDGAKTEFDVALSARDRLEPELPRVAVPQAPVERAKDDGPRAIVLKHVTYFGESPSIVFNRAKKWLVDAIIKIAAGSEEYDRFPRIAPLVDKPELGTHGTTRAELSQLSRDIRDMADRLRPPLSENFSELGDLMKIAVEKLGDGVPGPDEVKDVMSSFMQMFGKPDDDEYGLGTEDWKKNY